MTSREKTYVDALAAQVEILTEATNKNCVSVAKLAESVAALKDMMERTWQTVCDNRSEQAAENVRLWEEIRAIREDLNGAMNELRNEISGVRYLAGALSVVAVILGTIVGRWL